MFPLTVQLCFPCIMRVKSKYRGYYYQNIFIVKPPLSQCSTREPNRKLQHFSIVDKLFIDIFTHMT